MEIIFYYLTYTNVCGKGKEHSQLVLKDFHRGKEHCTTQSQCYSTIIFHTGFIRLRFTLPKGKTGIEKSPIPSEETCNDSRNSCMGSNTNVAVKVDE